MTEVYLSMEEASKLTGLSKSTLYKMTAKRKISFYKPFGKKIFFTREQLDGMMKKNLVKAVEVLEGETMDELLNKKNYENG